MYHRLAFGSSGAAGFFEGHKSRPSSSDPFGRHEDNDLWRQFRVKGCVKLRAVHSPVFSIRIARQDRVSWEVRKRVGGKRPNSFSSLYFVLYPVIATPVLCAIFSSTPYFLLPGLNRHLYDQNDRNPSRLCLSLIAPPPPRTNNI